MGRNSDRLIKHVREYAATIPSDQEWHRVPEMSDRELSRIIGSASTNWTAGWRVAKFLRVQREQRESEHQQSEGNVVQDGKDVG